MSRARRGAVAAGLCLAAALLAAASPLAARQQSAAERALVQHLDTLLPILREARLQADRAAAARELLLRARPTETQDTLAIGLLRVVTFPDQAHLARSVVGGAWDGLSGMVTESRYLREFTFTFHWSSRKRTVVVDRPYRSIEAPVWAPPGIIEGNAREAIGAILFMEMQRTRLLQWVRGSIRAPLHPERVYRELATVPSHANRACMAGDLDACWTALGPGADSTRLPRWYSPEEMPLRVASIGPGRWWPAPILAARLKCLERGSPGSQPACARFLAAVAPEIAAPLGMEARRLLLWVALEAGGPGSFDRLVADPGMPTADALLAASGLSAEELTSRWREQVLAARPDTYSGLGASAGLALFWFLVFGALALRSTRWRPA